MKKIKLFAVKNISKKNLVVAFFCTLLLLVGINLFADDHKENDKEKDEHGEIKKGPHNGRLLVDGKFTLELAIFEKGVPPEYRAWASFDGKPLTPKEWQLNVELTRLGGATDKFNFLPQDDFLRGKSEVKEPHSFDVSVTATYKNQTHHWAFPSYEGRVKLNADLAKASGVTTAIANAGTLQQTLKLYGQVLADPVRVSHIQARYPGVIRNVKVTIGSKVNAGDVLASVESNDSLRQYNIVAPISGVIIERHANVDEFTADKTLFILVDYSQLEVDIQAFPSQISNLKAGQSVTLHTGELTVTSHIEYLTPHNEGAATLVAHAAINNSDGRWTPNQIVEADIAVNEIPVALMLDKRALQNFRDWQVVFIKVGDNYEIRPLELGQSDGQFIEVLNGLKPGDAYVVENAYLLKADLEKSGASHDH